MAAKGGHPVAQGFGLMCLIAGSIGLGFALGLARPRQVLVTPPSTPTGGSTASAADVGQDDVGQDGVGQDRVAQDGVVGDRRDQ